MMGSIGSRGWSNRCVMLRVPTRVAVLVISFLVVLPTLPQTLEAERLEYDSLGNLTYLERAYHDGDTLVYFMAYSDGGRLLKYSKELRGDTILECYKCHDLESKVLLESENGDELLVSTSEDSLTIAVLGYQLETKWDTTLSIEAGTALVDLYHQSSKEFARLVLEGRVPYEPERATLRETWAYRACNGRLVDKRIFRWNGEVSNRQDFMYNGDALVALSYFGWDTIPYAVDSLAWNKDTSSMHVVNRWLDSPGRVEYTLTFSGDTSVESSGTTSVTNHWAYDHTPWDVRLREAALREGGLCQSRIRRVQECLLERSCDQDECIISEHRWDPQGRLTETQVSRDGRLERRIQYRYY